ncbi:hypothetical protein VP01_967g1 [Puccinia sorghi]|uniref:Uncharacterized protein n=1 Tax=Puccinia sorghi TaxID=27349 RepID=A0A0L6U610_9BASI|nr:hypothetical protein VP01_967g1 [Puccinia sorghi]
MLRIVYGRGEIGKGRARRRVGGSTAYNYQFTNLMNANMDYRSSIWITTRYRARKRGQEEREEKKNGIMDMEPEGNKYVSPPREDQSTNRFHFSSILSHTYSSDSGRKREEKKQLRTSDKSSRMKCTIKITGRSAASSKPLSSKPWWCLRVLAVRGIGAIPTWLATGMQGDSSQAGQNGRVHFVDPSSFCAEKHLALPVSKHVPALTGFAGRIFSRETGRTVYFQMNHCHQGKPILPVVESEFEQVHLVDLLPRTFFPNSTETLYHLKSCNMFCSCFEMFEMENRQCPFVEIEKYTQFFFLRGPLRADIALGVTIPHRDKKNKCQKVKLNLWQKIIELNKSWIIPWFCSIDEDTHNCACIHFLNILSYQISQNMNCASTICTISVGLLPKEMKGFISYSMASKKARLWGSRSYMVDCRMRERIGSPSLRTIKCEGMLWLDEGEDWISLLADYKCDVYNMYIIGSVHILVCSMAHNKALPPELRFSKTRYETLSQSHLMIVIDNMPMNNNLRPSFRFKFFLQIHFSFLFINHPLIILLFCFSIYIKTYESVRSFNFLRMSKSKLSLLGYTERNILSALNTCSLFLNNFSESKGLIINLTFTEEHIYFIIELVEFILVNLVCNQLAQPSLLISHVWNQDLLHFNPVCKALEKNKENKDNLNPTKVTFQARYFFRYNNMIHIKYFKKYKVLAQIQSWWNFLSIYTNPHSKKKKEKREKTKTKKERKQSHEVPTGTRSTNHVSIRVFLSRSEFRVCGNGLLLTKGTLFL